MNRRFFLTGLAAGICAPAIIRPGLLMPVKPMPGDVTNADKIIWHEFKNADFGDLIYRIVPADTPFLGLWEASGGRRVVRVISDGRPVTIAAPLGSRIVPT